MDFFESFEKYVLPELQAEEEMRKQPLSEELFDIEDTPGEKTKIEVPPVLGGEILYGGIYGG